MRVTIEHSSGIVWEMLSWWTKPHGLGSTLENNFQVRCCFKKCNLKLYYAKMKACINFARKRRRILWAWSHLRWTERQCKHVTFHISACFGENKDVWFYMQIQTVTDEKCKNQPLRYMLVKFGSYQIYCQLWFRMFAKTTNACINVFVFQVWYSLLLKWVHEPWTINKHSWAAEWWKHFLMHDSQGLYLYLWFDERETCRAMDSE